MRDFCAQLIWMVPGCDCFIKSSSSGLMVIFTIAELYLKTALLSDFNTHTHDTSDRFFFGFLDLVDPSDLHFSVSGQVLTWLTAESQLRVSVNLGTSAAFTLCELHVCSLWSLSSPNLSAQSWKTSPFT